MTDVERMLADALRPIEPPERLSGRVEDTLGGIAQAAAERPGIGATRRLSTPCPSPPW